MPLVEVVVNGREYQVGCDTGQEDRLRELAQMFDKRVHALVSTIGQVGDARLMLIAGLVLADELSSALAKSSEAERELTALKAKLDNSADSLERAESGISELLERAALRIESIAARVAAP